MFSVYVARLQCQSEFIPSIIDITMTLNELCDIVAAAREWRFGRASKVWHISQLPLSIAVRKLEEALGA